MKEFKNYLTSEAEKCSEILYSYLPQSDKNTQLFDAISYSARSGGKRLRMIIMREAARLFSEADVSAFAAAIEMIHTYSLIHDDLPAMDNSDIRRGQPSVHKKFNECLAILAGDGLFHLAFEIMSADALEGDCFTKLRAINVIASKTGLRGMIYGQALDTENPAPDKSLKSLIDQRKTADMFIAAAAAGAILGGAGEKAAEDVVGFAENFGIAYQIIDDIADGDADKDKMSEAKQHLNAAIKLIMPYDKKLFFQSLCRLFEISG